MSIQILQEGSGELIGWHDPDENRQWVREHKPRDLRDKRTTVKEAVEKFVRDGDFIAFGGFGHIRIPMAVVYEIIRQQKRGLVIAGKTAVHDVDLLLGAGCVNRIEVAYAFGHELRGLSPAGRRAVETGQCKVVAEISNAGYQWRFLAGMMGIPFIPSRNMLGTDTLKHSACKVVEDPWSGKPVCLIPAAYPDVAMFHVPRCDMYGNARIDGIIVEDFELARAARRVIVTTEEIVDTEVIRAEPCRTVIPFYVVDAVCEVPYGAHPTLMPYLYFFDEEHIGEWEHPTARLPGSGGANDIGSLCHRTIIVMRQDKRRFVERVNFITTPGYLDGPGARERAGLPEETGPYRVITQLGVYDFEEQTKRLRLLAMHPGVTLEEIQANSAFAVPIPGWVEITTPPTEDERRLLREIDPIGMVLGK